MAETNFPLYPRVKSAIAVRHVSDDRLVAWVEIVSPGNKAARRPFQEVQEDEFQLPADKPLTMVAYECDLTTRAYIEPVAIGDVLPNMPLFLEPNGCVMVPLEATYQSAYIVLPRRWQRVLEAPPS